MTGGPSYLGREAWTEWRQLLAQAADEPDLRSRLRAVAYEIGNALPRDSTSLAQWRRVGVRVMNIPGSSEGLSVDGADRIVVVSRSEKRSRGRERFTIAHEVGHLLLDDVVEKLSFPVSLRELEQICEWFARNVLIPDGELAERIALLPEDLSVEDVAEMARWFGVNFAPLVRALQGKWSSPRFHVVYATKRGHPKRQDVEDFRVDDQAGTDVFFPWHQRLMSLGLKNLSRWAATARPADDAVGWMREVGTDRIRVRLRGVAPGRRSGVAEGAVRWQALRARVDSLLVLVEVSHLSKRWYTSKSTTDAPAAKGRPQA